MKSLKILLLTLIFSFVSSCGFIDDEPVKDQDIYVSNELSAGCNLDTDSFGSIFEADIEAQIHCLENNFIQFSKYVRSTDRGTISEGELSDFVKRFFKENSDTVIQGLKLIFELNMLLLRDEANSINRDNISPLFKLLVTVNKEAIIITKTLREMESEKDQAKFFSKRQELENALNRFTKTSLEIISKPDTLTKKIVLKKFLLDLNKRLNLGKDVIDEKLANAILFIKKLFFGGNKEILTSEEISLAIAKLPKLILMATDFILIKDYHFSDTNKYYDFQSTILNRFKEVIFDFEDTEEILNIEDLYTLFDRISKEDEDFDIREYEKIFTSIKRDLIGGDVKVFNYKEFKHLLNYIGISVHAINGYQKHQKLTKDIQAKTLKEKIKIKEEFVNYIDNLALKAKNQIEAQGGLPNNVDILKFAKTVTQEIDSIKLKVQFIEAIFGVKIAIAGGKKNLLTSEEMYLVLTKLKNIASLYFDTTFINQSYTYDSSKKWHFIAEALDQAFPLLIKDESVEALKIEDIAIILEEFFQTDEDHSPIVNAGVKLSSDDIKTFTETLKNHILTTTPESINVVEIKSTLKLIQLGMSIFEFTKFYDEKAALAKLDPDSVDIFANEVESRARNLEVIIERDLPTLKGVNRNLDYLAIAKSVGILFKESSIDGDYSKQEDFTNLVRKLSPLKTILLGGKRDIISFGEILNFAPKLSTYTKSIFKLSLSDFSDENNNESYFSLLLETFSNISKNLVIDTSLEYFEAKELLESLNLIVGSKKIDFTKFTSSLVNFKGRVMHQILDPEVNPADIQEVHTFTAVNIARILEYTQKALEVTYFNEKTYNVFSKKLESTRPISWLNLSRVKEYPGIRNYRIPSLRKDFLDTVTKYRHYTYKVEKLGPTDSPVTRFIQYFGTDYKRTKYGHVLTSVVKYFFNIVLEGYTVKHNDIDVVDIPRINMLFLDLKPVLEELGLWTSNFETFGENIILLSDLFQNTSNGDNALGIDEAVEFTTIVLTASSLTDEVMYEMKEYCPNQGRGDVLAFDTSCYKENLFEIWINKLGYGKMFPKLARYYNSQDRASVIEYIKKTQGFARDVSDETIPMAKRDFTLLIGAMLNIESTFVRFDTNNDNVIDTEELDRAFLIYEASVQKMADLNGWKSFLTKTVFYYMVKNMSIPTTAQVAAYHIQLNYNPMYKENIQAQRLNIGALLYNLLEYRK